MSEFKDITPAEFACSYSASCPSVKISEDGRTLRITGKNVPTNEYHAGEVTLDISAEIVVKALAAIRA